MSPARGGRATSVQHRIEYLPARPIPADGESLMSFVSRAAASNGTTVAAILGRNEVARTAPDYEVILRHLAKLTRQPPSRISAMTLDGCHSQVIAKEAWGASTWGQYCPCAPHGVKRRDWALSLAPVCFHCGHLLEIPGRDAAQQTRVPDRIMSVCREVSFAAHRSAVDFDALARLQILRVDLPWAARRISRSSLDPDGSDGQLVNAAAVDLASMGEFDGSVGELPRSSAVRALAITMAWEAQRAWVPPRTMPHPRPALVRRVNPQIRDTQVFTRRVLRTGSKTVETMRLPGSSVRHPRRDDLIRLVLGHTELRFDHIPGIYRQDGDPFVLDSVEWLWRSRIATLLGQCTLLRDRWTMADEPTYRLTRGGDFIRYKGSWPRWSPIFFLESDIAHAMNFARALSEDGLVNYRERRDALRGTTSISQDLAGGLPPAARNLNDCRSLAAAWMWFDATCDSPRTQRDAHRLAAFDTALNPEGRLILRSTADALCNAASDLTHAVRRAGSGDIASEQTSSTDPIHASA